MDNRSDERAPTTPPARSGDAGRRLDEADARERDRASLEQAISRAYTRPAQPAEPADVAVSVQALTASLFVLVDKWRGEQADYPQSEVGAYAAAAVRACALELETLVLEKMVGESPDRIVDVAGTIVSLRLAVEDRDDADRRYRESPYASMPNSIGAITIREQSREANERIEAAIQRLIAPGQRAEAERVARQGAGSLDSCAQCGEWRYTHTAGLQTPTTAHDFVEPKDGAL